ncbi:RidA family protein [Amycolatopsis jejuensis]|uniref:RidA family protein n=1 Tax=Amycolatopsis jejuensis TaxID=330084 RepID=UPI000525C1A9|nr:RidA family protein [Amycolatopsis jejuensis]
MTSPEQRLTELGIQLPPLRPRAGNYLGYVRHGDLLYLSGQGADGHFGHLGADRTVEDGRRAARDCMLNLLAQTRSALGSLDHVGRIVKLLGFVACTPDFRDAPQVIDGASSLLHEVFGAERGGHARSAIGAAALPLGFSVEIEMVVAVAG